MLTTTALHQISLGFFGVMTPVFGAAAVVRRGGLGRFANAAMVVGVLLLAFTIYVRGVEVRHAPFQTLYEVYLVLAVCLAISYLLIWASGGLEILRRAGPALVHAFGAFTSVAVVVVLALGLRVGDFQTDLPPALQSPWFVPHVIVYLFGYGSLGLAMVSSLIYLTGRRTAKLSDDALQTLDQFTHRIIAMGFPFLTAGLIFGSLWAYEAWANYWAWDSKEVWSLITWFAYLVYMHLRLVRGWRGRPAAWMVVLGGVSIFVTLLLFGYLPASITSVHNYGP
jgi:cytochrome c-type biogenesis protein CcsB